ncbi:MAG: DPP IV N-terminal domain-containing protein, partial [Pseudomonadales bacterium]|nr:DPP IV N-terminal domain-containing protein [Pseudomonadales bacterium]
IMADPVWIGTSPASPRWSPDGSSLVYDIPQPEGRRQQTFRADPGQPATIISIDGAAIEQHSIDRKVIAPNGDTVWSFAGNVYLRSEQEIRQLTRDTARQTAPGFLTDGNVFWQEDNSIIVYHRPTGTYREIASWRFEKAPTASEPVADFIGREQLALITSLSQKRSEAETSASEREALTEQSGAWAPKPFYLPEDAELIRASYSPAGRWLLLVTGTKVKKNPEDTIPHYVDDSGRIVHKPVRARVADAEPVSHQLWLADIQNHNLQALDLSTLPGYDEDVLKDVLKENARARSETYKSKRAARFIRLMTHRGAGNSDPVIWHPNGQQVALMLESWDNKDRWIVTLNAADDAPTLISQHRLHDQAWVNNYAFNEFGWLKGDPRLFYLSEESGYAHLYVREPGSKARQLTSGQFEVSDVTLSPDGDAFYFKSNKIHPGVYEIYRLPTEGGEPTQLTNFDGQTSYELSPDGEWLLLTSSRANQPPELFLSAAANASAPVQLTTTVTSEFLSYQWPEPEFVSFPVKGTRQAVHARLYLPEENRRNSAAVFFIHGAGYLQNSHKGWSDYFREYMFNVMLSRQGYVVMDIDYRASAGYGRDWRTAIYRDMGQPETEDFRAAID